MRVIAGTARSLALKTLPGLETRPTTDRIKETLFNMIGPEICESRFLDLFSGSGAIGIEALSRGAREAVFVEQNRKACGVIRENLKFTRLEKNAAVMETDVRNALVRLKGSFDVIFMDPPYRKDLEKEVLMMLRDSDLLNENSLLIVEASLDTDFSYLESWGYHVVKRKEYKTNVHMFIRRI